MEKKEPESVVFVLWSGDAGIFVSASQYDRDRRVLSALEDSNTWGDFRQMVPDDVFQELFIWWSNGGEYIYDNGHGLEMIDPEDLSSFTSDFGNENRLIHCNSFDRSVFGEDAGDDLIGLQSATCDHQFPEEFRQQFGMPVATMMSGSWIEYPLDQLDEMIEHLNACGYKVLKNLELDGRAPAS